MKKNDIRNTNLMAALTIGITAMMSLSTPVTAYAADPNDPNATIENTPNEPTTQQESQEQAIQVDSVTTEAHEQAEVVQAEATEATDSALAEATQAAETILMGNEEAGIEAATAGEAGTISDKAIDALIEAAQDITVDDKDEEGNITDASAVTHLENATETIETVKAELQAAETANYNAEVSAQTIDDEADVAFENAAAAIEVSENIEKDVQETQEKADRLIEAIKEAENEESAQALYDELTEAVSDAETSVADKKAYYVRLMENYDKAVSELRRAEEALEVFEKAYAKNLDDAFDKAEEAEKDIEEAQTKVDNLAKALENVDKKLIQEAQDADEIADAFALVDGKNWDLQRDAAMKVVENYIIPQLEEKEISNVQWEVVKGFDRQDYNYTKITYTENGNEVTRYFNIDRLNKEASDDRYAKLGSSYGFAVYEKTEEELAAEAFLIEQYGNETYYSKTHPDVKNGSAYNTLKEKANAGDLDVFKYTNENGERVLLTREMLNAAIESGDIIDNDGEMKTKDGQVVQEIVQNQNNLLHDGNAFLVANEVDVTTTKKYKNQIMKALNNSNVSEEATAKYDAMVDANHTYNTYVAATKSVVNEDGEKEHHLSAKYNSYDEVVADAQEAVNEAKEEAEKLTDAIDTLRENNRRRTILAVDALGVTDIATYLGIEVTAERATELNNMTVSQAITALDGYLEDAGNKVETAESNLETVKAAPAIALQELNTVLTKLNPRSTNPVVPPSTGGGDGSGTTIDTEPDPEGEGLTAGGTNPTIIPDEEVSGSDTPEGGTGTGQGENVVPQEEGGTQTGGSENGQNVAPDNAVPSGDAPAGGGNGQGENVVPQEEGGTQTGGSGNGHTVTPDNVVPTGDAPVSGGGTGQSVTSDNVVPAGGTGQSVTPDNGAPAGGGTSKTVISDNVVPTSDAPTADAGNGQGVNVEPEPEADGQASGTGNGQSVDTQSNTEGVAPAASVTPTGEGTSQKVIADNEVPTSATPSSEAPTSVAGNGQTVDTEPDAEGVAPTASTTPSGEGTNRAGITDNAAPTSATPSSEAPTNGAGNGQTVDTEPDAEGVAPTATTPTGEGTSQAEITDNAAPTSATPSSEAPTDGTENSQTIVSQPNAEGVAPAASVTPTGEGTNQTIITDNEVPTSAIPANDAPASAAGNGQTVDTEPEPEGVTPAAPTDGTGNGQSLDTEPNAEGVAPAVQADGETSQTNITDDVVPTSDAPAGYAGNTQTTQSTTATTVAGLQSQTGTQPQTSLADTLTGTQQSDDQSQSLSDVLQTGERTDSTVGTGNDTTDTITTIPDDEVATSDAPKTNKGQDKEVTSIIDDKVALANVAEVNIGDVDNMPVSKDKMNWWWLLIIALLGEKGRRMYEKYKEEHEAKEGPQK